MIGVICFRRKQITPSYIGEKEGVNRNLLEKLFSNCVVMGFGQREISP